MRKVYQTPNGFKTEDGEPATEEEIEYWHKEICQYCSGGFLHKKDAKTIEEECNSAIPCPICLGKGRLNESKKRRFENLKITRKNIVLDADSFQPKQKIVVEFDDLLESQQDGRIPKRSTIMLLKAYELGMRIVQEMHRINNE